MVHFYCYIETKANILIKNAKITNRIIFKLTTLSSLSDKQLLQQMNKPHILFQHDGEERC